MVCCMNASAMPPERPPVQPRTPVPPQPAVPPQPDRRRGGRAGLIVAVVVLGVVILAGAALLILLLTGGAVGTPVHLAADAEAGSSVAVRVPNSAIRFEPSPDSQVHVRADGSSLGATPTLAITTANGVTEVTGGCPSQWLGFCSLNMTVALPAALSLTADGVNGQIEASALTGALRLTTTNGAVETTGTLGRVEVHTTNGAIRVRDAGSRRVVATTTNGAVEVDFRDAPEAVEARSTNGSITVRMPAAGLSYLVDARTTNGNVDTGSVPSDPSARRTIIAQTTNGDVRVTTG
ncbi:hypothetical protein E3O55_14660 [Cryobacterium sp. MDB1-18-2]|uniref:DUF4097 domain-containing protein n=2 Tax=Microbacteriaceae TaxID=85023 RepID=A0ABY2IRY6_9MICO|nr:hypothetical protein E3O39_02215 [Cryobacterium sp. MDB2-A-1]TFC10154.1 hypothetical protein E3O59_04075 [Cryobacterium sp. MDB2-33-2]TFC13398.1 hypothetical protein E3O51_17250 [Cryobacterium sp. MDB2-10]TFC14207.1 hypothetical protein E3O35_04485 [Cryobacterium sp. MDB2-A-2]TFC22518.1 hypothetical protein E3O46_03495 [Cryobacterium glucosi]TFC25375.1 hypothetical protein E3O55_14660 [Cryobacterium sp. MDB1-18-2]TFC43568.1 hypothetical protein E3O50_07045 [Cryobacterium sp. MDB1-18-1]